MRHWLWTPSSGCCWKCAWEALERGGIDPAACGARDGVFAGACSSGLRPTAARRRREAEGYSADRTAISVAVGPGRLHASAWRARR